MAVIKNHKTGMWEVRTYYKDLTGARKQKTKRGFAKKSEALEWERNFKLKEDQSISMSFKSFVDIYLTDLEPRIKRNTFLTKKHIIETKILPYFGKRKLDDIRTSDVIQWQNEIMKLKKDNGELFSPTYLKTIHNQLSAILNHAVNMYGLKDNVARKAGTMGKEENKEMEFWTQDEFQAFLECVADKPISYYAYHKLFDKALKEYNAKQKRKDRQIKSYYDKISRSKQEKLFYEVIVQIGNRDDTGVGSSSAEVATWVLKDYVKKFQLRNPQLYVIGAYIHLDEETPHLHLNFIPWVSGCKRGLETKTSLKAALATRGFVSEGKGDTEWKQWAEAEKDDIALIMSWYGIDWKKKDTHNKHLSVLDYKKQERAKEVAALEEEIEGAQVVLELKEERIDSLEKEIESKQDSFRKEQSEAQKKLDDTISENQKLQSETTDLRLKNSQLRLEYYENIDKLTDKQKEIEVAQKEADKWMMI